ncbi:hypothetical protein [Actinoplanes sp. HUAS TT8]|uniref:hypothetical protein n=1 Tax=Actinoplanes sp. HUAS TT8 TaxID=3447453 RepID=UPI003F523D74
MTTYGKLLARFVPVLVVALVLIAAGVSPGVRTMLRESFTRMPTEYTELYFTAEPSLTGTGAKARIAVPIGLLHHGASTSSYVVRAQVSTPDGQAGPAAEKDLTARPETPDTVMLTVTAPGSATSYDVKVTLPGHEQTLQFRLKS